MKVTGTETGEEGTVTRGVLSRATVASGCGRGAAAGAGSGAAARRRRWLLG